MPSMATIEDIEDAITQLKETGIYHVKNGDIGTAILGMEETGSQFSISEGGLTFYKRNVFANDVRIHINIKINGNLLIRTDN